MHPAVIALFLVESLAALIMMGASFALGRQLGCTQNATVSDKWWLFRAIICALAVVFASVVTWLAFVIYQMQ